MKFDGNFAFLWGLLFVCRQCLAQRSGYNYVRPELTVGANDADANAVGGKVGAGGYSPSITAVGAYPTAATAYGRTVGTSTSAVPQFGGYPAPQAQRVTGVGATGGFVPTSGVALSSLPTSVGTFAGTTAGLAQRTALPQRTTGGVYQAQPQFAAGARGITATGTGTGTGAGAVSGSDETGDYSAIPGVPGVDYPIYSQVPQTNFDCAQQPLPGYYSDVEALCQVFHICALNRTYSFLCPNGTVFSQETLVCVWWNQYDCASAPSLYANNAYIYDYGAAGAPTNTALQSTATQFGVTGSSAQRVQSGFASGNTARTSGGPTGGIFGSGSYRGNVAGSNYVNLAANAPSVNELTGNTGAKSTTTSGRFSPTAAQTFPSVSGNRVATPPPFGTVLRGSAGSNVVTAASVGASNIQEAAYANSQGVTSTTNREYLPPPSRRP